MTTDEKIAERYVNGIPIFAEEGEGFSRTQMQQAFLAGLKAGKDMNVPIKWHKVADGDLLSDKHGHVVFNQDWDKVVIRNGRFEYLDGYKANVIAWCEIPKYTEE